MPLTPPGRASPMALGVPLYAPAAAPQAPPVPPPAAGSLAQVLIAWGSPPFSASPAWTDVTAFVRFETPLAMQRGRQDNISLIPAGRLTVTCDNSDGRFTAGRSASPYGAANVKIGRRIQVNVPDENGAMHTRFDGLITELPAAWEGPAGYVNLAVIQASDILAWLARQPPLLSWTQQEMLADSPIALYSGTDASGAAQAADQAGQGAAPLQVISQGDGTGAAAAGSGVPLAEIQSSGSTAQQQATAVFSFTNPGPFSVTFPPGTRVSCDVTCVAGGQAGTIGGLSTGGAAGRSGECAREPNLAVTPGGTYTGTVGAAGVPSAGSGGDTSFTGDAVTVLAHASGSGSTNAVHSNGATGGAASGANGGGGASSGGIYQPGNNGIAGAGGGTAVTGGGAGGAGDTTGAGGTAGAQPGGGGGGGKAGGSPGQGGAGGAGSCIITYAYIPAPAAQQGSSLPSWLFTPSPTLAARVLQGQLPQPVTAAAGFALELRGAFAGFPAQSAVTFTTPGSVSFTGPPGALTADVTCTAGGQAGANGGASNGGAGGTGGESAEEAALQITPDTAYAGTVGAAGTPGGGLGGNTTFTGDTVTVQANASGSGSTNTSHHNGGAGGAFNGANGGGGGAAGGTFQGGNNGLSIGSTGGTAVTGGGAGGAGDTTLAGGTPGLAPGGGGGGGKGGLGGGIQGGSGAPGQLTVTVQPSACTLATLVSPRGQNAIAVWVTSAGHLQLASTSGYGTRSPAWATADAGQVPPGAFHIIVSAAAGTGAATLWVNGAAAGTLTLPAGASYTWLTVGGAYGSWLGGWNGSAGLAAVYPAPLPGARAGVHYTAGATGFAGSATGTMIARIAGYTGLPPFYYTAPSGTADPSWGLTLVSYLDLKGQNPLAAMQAYEMAEGGVLYVSAAGKLTFADRASRYAAGAAGSALTLAAGQYGTDTTFRANDQYLCTQACYATANIPGGYPVTNTAAVADYGPYTQNAGSPGSPQAAPFADAAAAAGTFSADDLMDAGNWQAGVLGQPVPRIPATTIDLRTLPAAEFSIASFYGTDIGSAVQLAGLPSQAPDAAASALAAYHVIEGINETVGTDARDAVLSTSPLALNAAWIPGDPLLGVLGSTDTVGRSAAPAALGPPYPVPTFGATLNRTGSAGAQDWRGLTVNVQNRLTPPLLIAQQASAQTVTTLAGQPVTFDTLLADTAAGMTTTTAYVIPAGFPGYWWCAAVVQAATGNGSLGGIAAWFAAVLGGVASQWHARSAAYLSTAPYGAVAISGRIGPCAAGDTIAVIAAAAGSPASMPLGTADGGSMLTLVWQGS